MKTENEKTYELILEKVAKGKKFFTGAVCGPYSEHITYFFNDGTNFTIINKRNPMKCVIMQNIGLS